MTAWLAGPSAFFTVQQQGDASFRTYRTDRGNVSGLQFTPIVCFALSLFQDRGEGVGVCRSFRLQVREQATDTPHGCPWGGAWKLRRTMMKA